MMKKEVFLNYYTGSYFGFRVVYKDGKQFHQEEETRIILDKAILNYKEHSNFYSIYMEQNKKYIHVLRIRVYCKNVRR